NRLEMPKTFAGACIQGDERIGEQVVAFAIGAVKIVGGRTEREEGNSAFLVDGDVAPHVGAAHVFPSVLRICFVTELARIRNRMECPHELSCNDVERTKIARRRHIALTWGRSENQQILENLSGAVGLNLRDLRGIAFETFAKI